MHALSSTRLTGLDSNECSRRARVGTPAKKGRPVGMEAIKEPTVSRSVEAVPSSRGTRDTR